jgi:hypothetical protein
VQAYLDQEPLIYTSHHRWDGRALPHQLFQIEMGSDDDSGFGVWTRGCTLTKQKLSNQLVWDCNPLDLSLPRS